jgi:hypothetical protein
LYIRVKNQINRGIPHDHRNYPEKEVRRPKKKISGVTTTGITTTGQENI